MSTQNIGVTVCNFTAELDAATNCKRMLAIIKQVGSKSDVIVFPEACLQGYVPFIDQQTIEYYQREAVDLSGRNRYIDQITKSAISNKIVVVFGFIEKGLHQKKQEVFYNSACIIDTDGTLQTYRKTHLAADEPSLFAPGTCLPVFTTSLGLVGLMICHDRCFPEVARSYALKGAEIIISLSAWGYTDVSDPERSSDHSPVVFDLYDQTRAVENQCLLLSANQVGIIRAFDDKAAIHFVGRSKIVHPSGRILAGSGEEEAVVTFSLNLSQVLDEERKQNENAQFLLDQRREEIYQ